MWTPTSPCGPQAGPGRSPDGERSRSTMLRCCASSLTRVAITLLDELTLALPERLGLRRIELCRLRISDVDLDHRTVEEWGKGDKYRTMPLLRRRPTTNAPLGVAAGRRRLEELFGRQFRASGLSPLTCGLASAHACEQELTQRIADVCSEHPAT